jgi:hypothetical protein
VALLDPGPPAVALCLLAHEPGLGRGCPPVVIPPVEIPDRGVRELLDIGVVERCKSDRYIIAAQFRDMAAIE